MLWVYTHTHMCECVYCYLSLWNWGFVAVVVVVVPHNLIFHRRCHLPCGMITRFCCCHTHKKMKQDETEKQEIGIQNPSLFPLSFFFGSFMWHTNTQLYSTSHMLNTHIHTYIYTHIYTCIYLNIFPERGGETIIARILPLKPVNNIFSLCQMDNNPPKDM